MSDETPIDTQEAGEAEVEVCTATRILILQREHRDLDSPIEELYEFPYLDQLMLQRLKKRKLAIRDTIERLKDSLIPDLNA